jgi:hypothetical protein
MELIMAIKKQREVLTNGFLADCSLGFRDSGVKGKHAAF